jgi:hypothetical protein
MSDHLAFRVVGATAMSSALVPTVAFDLHVTAPDGVDVQSVQLRCQIRVEPDRRRYSPSEQERLEGLFGTPDRWGETLRAFLLTHVSAPVHGFIGQTDTTLPVELSYDMDVAAGSFLQGLQEGVVPLAFLFSGTVFLRTSEGLQVEPIPWDREARYDLPVGVWRDAIDVHFPGTGWIRLQRDVIDQLAAYRRRHGLLSWDDTLTRLLAEREART